MPEAHNHSRHRVESQEYSETGGDIRKGVNDGADEQPHLDKKGHRIFHVSKADIESREDQTQSTRSQQGAQNVEGHPDATGRERPSKVDHQPKHEKQTNEQVDHQSRYASEWNEDARKVYLGDERLIAHQTVTRDRHRICEKGPKNQARIGKERIRRTVSSNACETAKNDSADQTSKQRLEQTPQTAQDRLFVADLDVPPH